MYQRVENMTLRIFPDLEQNCEDESRIVERAILASPEDGVRFSSKIIGCTAPGNMQTFLSASPVEQFKFKSCTNSGDHFINLLKIAFFPDHRLTLKKSYIVMLFRNLQPSRDYSSTSATSSISWRIIHSFGKCRLQITKVKRSFFYVITITRTIKTFQSIGWRELKFQFIFLRPL